MPHLTKKLELGKMYVS